MRLPRQLILQACSDLQARSDNHGSWPNGIPASFRRIREIRDLGSCWVLAVEFIVKNEAVRILSQENPIMIDKQQLTTAASICASHQLIAVAHLLQTMAEMHDETPSSLMRKLDLKHRKVVLVKWAKDHDFEPHADSNWKLIENHIDATVSVEDFLAWFTMQSKTDWVDEPKCGAAAATAIMKMVKARN